MFRFPRYFATISSVGVGIAVVALFVYYHNIAVNTVSGLSETYNAALAKNALGPVREPLSRFLFSVEEVNGVKTPQPVAVQRMIDEIMRDPMVVRMKIFTTSGRVAYSTDPRLIGTVASDDQGLAAALGGEVRSKMYYQGQFAFFADADYASNLIGTYIPVRESESGEIVGVLEIYRDGAQSIREIEAAERAVLLGAGVILLLLYAALIYVAGRVERRISAEQRTLTERAESLARLGAQMLNHQEAERLEIAKKLQDGAAQTLTAVRMNIASAAARGRIGGAEKQLSDQLPIIEHAIDEVIEAARDLHPTCLPRLGLVATAQWLCVEIGNKHPEIDLTITVSGDEAQITPHLKPIVYRTLERTLLRLATNFNTPTIKVELDAKRHAIRIFMTVERAVMSVHAARLTTDPDVNFGLAPIRDYVAVSGGAFESSEFSHGKQTINVRWPEAA
jgi:hypothetical protein